MEFIKPFVKFIKQRGFDVVEQKFKLHQSSDILNLPVEEEKYTTDLKQSQIELLSALENGNGLQYIQEKIALFNTNKLNGLSAPETSLFDILNAWSIDKVAITQFIPYYTTDVATAISIAADLDNFYSQAQALILDNFESLQSSSNTQLLESEEKYKDLFDNAHDLIHILEPDGKIIYVNSAWTNCLQFSMEEIKGKSIYSFITNEDQEKFIDYRKSVLAQTDEEKEITITLKTKNGEKIIAEGFVSSKFKDGKPVYTRGIFRDISQRIANERKLSFYNEQLIEREENLQQLIQHAPDAIIVIDVSGKIILWNPKAEELFGWKEAEILGQTLEETIIPPNYRQAHTQGMTRYLSTGKANILNRTIEITALNRQGEEFYISLTISKSQQSFKTIFISFIRDITQQKINEKELEDKRKELEVSNRELEQYAWLTSHDLREPLRKILTYSDIILTRNKKNLNEEVEKAALKIYNSGKRMTSLIEAILQYSSITNTNVLFEKVDLNKVLKEAIASLEIEIKEKRAEIKLEFLPTIEAVPFQMRQLLQNLIGNALKYNKENKKSRVKISAKNTDDNSVTIFIRDNGMGFEMKDEKKIFQLFKRLISQQKIPGIGIGLAICKKIVENHNGVITVDSKIDEGTTFAIQLPVKHSFT